MAQILSYGLVSRAIGLLLLAAAALKVNGLAADPVGRMGIFSTPEFQLAVVQFEIFLALWLLSAIKLIGSWLVTLATFSLFAVVSFYQGIIGQTSCGCFGRLAVSPWYAFTLDIAILAALAFGRPDLKPLAQNFRAGIFGVLRPAAVGLAGMVLVAGLLGLAHVGFGSVPAAIAHFRGERVSIQPRLVDAGTGAQGELREVSVLISPVSTQVQTSQPSEDSWKVQLLQEAPKAWQKYDARAKRLQGSWSLTLTHRYHSSTKKTKKHQYCYEMKQRSGSAMFLDQSTDGRGELVVVNPKYMFHLQRQRPDASWVVAEIGKGFFFESASIKYPDYFYIVQHVNRLPYTFAEIAPTLQITVLDPGCSIKKVVPVTKGDHRLVKVEFDYSPPKKESGKMPLRTGFVLFDPDRYWTIHSFDVQTQWGNDASKSIEVADFQYRQSSDGFPILQKIVLRSKRPSRNVETEVIRQFELREADIPEDEFRLSFYGFPEPQGVVWRDGGSTWYLWFIAIGVISLAVGGYFKYRMQQRKKMLAESS